PCPKEGLVDPYRFDDFKQMWAHGSRRVLLKTALAAGAVLVLGPVRRATGQDSGASCALALGQPCGDASACAVDRCPTYACRAGRCGDLVTDPANWSDRAIACADGESCQDGTCVIAAHSAPPIPATGGAEPKPARLRKISDQTQENVRRTRYRARASIPCRSR